MKNNFTFVYLFLFLLFSLIFPKDISGQVQPPEDLRKIGMDPYSQPEIQINLGKNKYDFYGSGDVNNDEIINYADVSEMQNGAQNDRADVDGDGVPSTANDQQILIDYLNGNIGHLPSDWNHLNGIEKRSWVQKMIAIDSVNYNPYVSLEDGGPDSVYDCGAFSKETLINFFGVDSLINYVGYYRFLQHGDENARFNIPIYMFFSKINPGVPLPVGTEPTGHVTNAVLVGPNDTTRYQEDPTNFNHWYLFEPQDDSEIYPGSPQINPNKPVTIKWWGRDDFIYGDPPTTFGYLRIIEFDLQNGEATPSMVNPWLLTSNPNDSTSGVDDNGGLENIVKSFDLENAYPNPTNGFVNIPYVSDVSGKVKFEVYNSLGQLVGKVEENASAGKNVFSYDFGNASSGMYIIRGVNSKGKQDAVKVLNMK